MSAAVFHVDTEALARATVGSEVMLPTAAGRHAVAVRRVRPGELVDLVDGVGGRVRAEIVEVRGRDHCRVRVGAVLPEPEPGLRFVVAQALLKGDQAERAIDLLTQAGVDGVIPWQAERCVARWDGDRTARGLQRWSDAMTAAAIQSRRARWPALHPCSDINGVATAVTAVRAAGGLALVLHEGADDGLVPEEVPMTGEILVIVGPEGGLTDVEVRALTAAGGKPTRLGTPVLRASSAGALAVAACSGLTRWKHGMIGT